MTRRRSSLQLVPAPAPVKHCPTCRCTRRPADLDRRLRASAAKLRDERAMRRAIAVILEDTAPLYRK